MEAELETLIARWELRAARKFQSAKAEKTLSGRQFIEHGATCYFNCASELRALIAEQTES
jgi:hypothetical protein